MFSKPALCYLLLLAAVVHAADSNVGEDWPCYQQNPQRTGATASRLSHDLALGWHWKSPQPPRPAWAGPAMWDAYANIRDLPAMRDYDSAHHAIAVGDHVFFGSTTDDTMRCLDASTGKVRWAATVDGPIRLAPTYNEGRLYFGSDDGHAYCLSADDGRLIWKAAAADSDGVAEPLLINNGRLISRHPVRTGVVVDKSLAYFGAALLPWETGFLCAVDKKTGKVRPDDGYRLALQGKTLEGPPALTEQQLVFPQGRVAPQLFQRHDGKDLGMLQKSSGGSIVVVTRDKVLHGPGANSKRGGIAASSAATRQQVATFGRGNAMVVDGEHIYMLADHQLIAATLDGKPRWKTKATASLSLIKAGDMLIAGGVDHVQAFSAADGSQTWQHRVPGRAKGLAVAQGRLFVSTDEGYLLAFHPAENGPSATIAGTNRLESDAIETAPDVAPLSAISDAQDRPLSRWVFRRDQTEGRKVRDLHGGQTAQLTDAFRWLRSADGSQESIQWKGQGSALVQSDFRKAKTPRKAMTVSAIVRVDQPTRWGGLVGIVQDNGPFERGWLLGFQQNKFTFALCSKQGQQKGRLTYLDDRSPFVAGTWHHVVGVYDGVKMHLYVDGRHAAASGDQAGDIWYPPKATFDIGAYHDDNEFYRLQGCLREVRLYDRALSTEEIQAQHEAARDVLRAFGESTEPNRPVIASGPAFRFDGNHAADVRWETPADAECWLEWWLEDEPARVMRSRSHQGRSHAARMTQLRANRRYKFRIVVHDGADRPTEGFVCDTFFNYNAHAPALPAEPTTALSDWLASQGVDAQHSRQHPNAQRHGRGLCLVWGGDVADPLDLARHYRVLVVDDDPRRVAQLRKQWLASGHYGQNVIVMPIPARDKPFSRLPGDWANLVVAKRQTAWLRDQLKPGGGVLLEREASEAETVTNENANENAKDAGQPTLVTAPNGERWRRSVRPPWSRASNWTHLYGAADNAAYTGETLGGVRSSDQMRVQWVGRPGPRYQADRSGRKPSPLAAGGRLYLQGWRRIVALDAHNGEPLWSWELPGFERFNVPRDCSNWCADSQHVYAAIGNQLWRFDGRTGDVADVLELPQTESPDAKHAWGFSARVGDMLLGTRVQSDAMWTNFWGAASAGWYDAKSGEVTSHVVSDELFGFRVASESADTPQQQWKYSGLVLNATITAKDDRIWFLECRDPKFQEGDSRRLPEDRWSHMHLVCLDAKTGKVRWQQPLDAPPGKVMASLAASDNRLVLMTSADNVFHVNSYSHEGGEPIWSKKLPWGRDNHGGHMSRPAIVGDRVYIRPFSLALADGAVQSQRLPVGGCGTYACTDNALFFRQSTVTVWDRATAKTSTWQRLRPDCWLSTIPAHGMLLSPEGGGGCSCGTWLETSIGFKPTKQK